MPSDLRATARAIGSVMLLGLSLAGAPVVAAPAATPPPAEDAATDQSADAAPAPTTTKPPAAAKSPATPTKKDADAANDDEFNPSESLSEDATVAYPVDI
jgi:hypothetical protein